MEGGPTAEELMDQTFIDQPAILDKHKAAAAVVDGKYKTRNSITTFSDFLFTLPVNARRMTLYERNR